VCKTATKYDLHDAAQVAKTENVQYDDWLDVQWPAVTYSSPAQYSATTFTGQMTKTNSVTSKMTIVTRSSVLRAVCGCVLRIHSHGRARYMLFLGIGGATVRAFS